MLASLEIKNYAIINHVLINFDKGLNIITGETGAGKSILLGALNLCLGERADSKALYHQEEKCTIEASFEIKAYQLQELFEKLDLDYQDLTLIRREISTSGKSRAFVNDTPVSLEVLKELATKLVNLTSQNETQELNKESYQLEVLDLCAKNQAQLDRYQAALKLYSTIEKELDLLQTATLKLQNDFDFFSFQLKEITDAQLENDHLEILESELNELNNIENIQLKLSNSIQYLENTEQSILSMLHSVYQELRELAPLKNSFKELAERVNSCIIELEDLKDEAEKLADASEDDPERRFLLNTKVNEANRLLRKHQLSSLEELNELKLELINKTASVESNHESIKKLEFAKNEALQNLEKEAKSLSISRKEGTAAMQKTIQHTLAKVGMPNAIFEIQLQEKNSFGKMGRDQVTYLFNANKGFAPLALNKIASGGELSRVMLSIQALLAQNTALPSLIFDEIDTGISGEVAAKVVEVFREISKEHQLIAITHLPQIAAKAENHLFIYKNEKEDKTETKIVQLNEEQHIKAIARMLSGEKISDESMSNAKSLIKN